MDWSLWDNSAKRSFVVAAKAKQAISSGKERPNSAVTGRGAKATKSSDINQRS